jgi:carbon storage regulator
MLVISRRNGQSIQIGDNTTVTILEIGFSQIKIGIDAPREVKILRMELVKEDEDGTSAVSE